MTACSHVAHRWNDERRRTEGQIGNAAGPWTACDAEAMPWPAAAGWIASEESDRARYYLHALEGPDGQPVWTGDEDKARRFSTREEARNTLRAASPGRVMRGFRRAVRRVES